MQIYAYVNRSASSQLSKKSSFLNIRCTATIRHFLWAILGETCRVKQLNALTYGQTILKRSVWQKLRQGSEAHQTVE